MVSDVCSVNSVGFLHGGNNCFDGPCLTHAFHDKVIVVPFMKCCGIQAELLRPTVVVLAMSGVPSQAGSSSGPRRLSWWG